MKNTTKIGLLFAITAGGCGAGGFDDTGSDVELQTQAVRLDTELTTSAHGGTGHRAPRCTWYGACVVDVEGSDLLRRSDLKAQGRIRTLTVWAGKYIDGFEVQWQNEANPIELIPSKHVGGFGGTARTMNFAPDEAIVRIDGRSGSLVDRLKITTNKGNSMTFGGSGGNSWQENVEQYGREIHGFKVGSRDDQFIDNIQFLTYFP